MPLRISPRFSGGGSLPRPPPLAAFHARIDGFQFSRFLTCWQTIAIKISRIRQISGLVGELSSSSSSMVCGVTAEMGWR